jgi:hypothetical protein
MSLEETGTGWFESKDTETEETIEQTQQRLDQVVLALDQERNALQSSEAKRKIVTNTDRGPNRQQLLSVLQSQSQELQSNERAIRIKLDKLLETETQLLNDFRGLEDRILLDRAMQVSRLQEEQRQKDAQARSEMITRLLENQSQAARSTHHEENSQIKHQGETKQGETKQGETKKETKKKRITNNSIVDDDECSICLIPVGYSSYYRAFSLHLVLTLSNNPSTPPILTRTTNDHLIGLTNVSTSCVRIVLVNDFCCVTRLTTISRWSCLPFRMFARVDRT